MDNFLLQLSCPFRLRIVNTPIEDRILPTRSMLVDTFEA